MPSHTFEFGPGSLDVHAIADADPDETDRLWRINYQTAFNVARAFFPLIRQAGGSFVFFASENVLEGVRIENGALGMPSRRMRA